MPHEVDQPTAAGKASQAAERSQSQTSRSFRRKPSEQRAKDGLVGPIRHEDGPMTGRITGRYLAAAYRRPTSSQWTMLKKAAI